MILSKAVQRFKGSKFGSDKVIWLKNASHCT
jgi:hypothetical protein